MRAASKRFPEKGFEDVTIADLMKEVGLTVGGFCKYFDSQNFALIRFASHIGQRCGAHKHRNVPNETAGAAGREDLLLPIARFEDFQLAAQDHRQPEITLASFKHQFPAPYDAARAKRLQHGELPIIELWKGNALRIAVELLVFVKFGHKQIR